MKTIHSTGMVYWYHRYRTYLLNICITTQIQYLIYYQYCCKKLLHFFAQQVPVPLSYRKQYRQKLGFTTTGFGTMHKKK